MDGLFLYGKPGNGKRHGLNYVHETGLPLIVVNFNDFD